jgi:hypothetical protein
VIPTTSRSTDELEAWLRDRCHTETGPYLRPFAPNARWWTARVFVVGTNPATPLRDEFESFEAYWRGLTSDVAAFVSVYRAKHGTGESRTTARVRKFVHALDPLDVLVCNAYAHPAPRKNEIPSRRAAGRVGREIFERLYGQCRPEAMLFHGAEAVRLAEEVFDVSLDVRVPLEAQTTTVEAGHSQVYALPHLSGMGAPPGYAVGRMDAELGRLAARIVNNAATR